jgi:hypothetical protein
VDGDWERVQADVLALYEQGRYREALDLVRREAPRFRDRPARMSYWEACLLCRTDRPDDAVEVFRRGSEVGLWWSEFVWEDPDLEPILDRPEIAEVRRDSERRRLDALAAGPARPRLVVLRPDGTPRAVAVVLHMYGVGPEATAEHWRGTTAAGIGVVLPESTQTGMDGTPAWDDRERTQRDVGHAATEGSRIVDGEEVPVILAGASQGGLRAIELAMAGIPVEPAAFIGVVASAPEGGSDSAIRAAAARGLRGWLVTGNRDTTREGLLTLHRELTGEGMECRLDDIPGLGHEYPADFSRRCVEALDFLLPTGQTSPAA